MEQSEIEAAYLGWVQALGFDRRGLFDGIRPLDDAIRAQFGKLSRGERVMLAFLLHVWEPARRRALLGDYDWAAEIQAADRSNRARIAEWAAEPWFVGAE